MLAFARDGQAADLANGVAWYPVLGVGTALLTLIAAGRRPGRPAVHRGRGGLGGRDRRHGGLLGGTAWAAPTNFRQRRLGADEAALTALFDRFQRWRTIRVSFQVTALAVAVTSSAPGADS